MCMGRSRIVWSNDEARICSINIKRDWDLFESTL